MLSFVKKKKKKLAYYLKIVCILLRGYDFKLAAELWMKKESFYVRHFIASHITLLDHSLVSTNLKYYKGRILKSAVHSTSEKGSPISNVFYHQSESDYCVAFCAVDLGTIWKKIVHKFCIISNSIPFTLGRISEKTFLKICRTPPPAFLSQ